MVLGTAVIVAGATYAVFHDTATVSGNTFSSGDADLKIKMPAEGCADWSDSCSGVSWSGVYPGWNKSYNLYLKNESSSPIILQIIPVIEETGSNQSLLDNTYMEIICTGNASTGRYSLTAWKSNAAVEIAPRLAQNEESGPCAVKFDIANTVGNEIANASIVFNLVLNANQVGEGTVEPTCASHNDCDDSNSETIDTCNAQGVCEHQTAPPASDTDGDGFNSDADCNDNDAAIHPSATEVCNGKDDDCDGITDEDLSGGSCDTGLQGICSVGTLSCQGGAFQCIQNSSAVTEICGNGLDDDCDGIVDNLDSDHDGFISTACGGNDCDDTRNTVFPESWDPNGGWDGLGGWVNGGEEICNGIDENCNGYIDEAAAGTIDNIAYFDNDNDGYGGEISYDYSYSCSVPAGYVINNHSDCNDANNAINPGANEVCGNGLDDDCDRGVDEGC